MSYTTDQILELLKSHKALLEEKYALSELGLFGSFARGDFRDDSDIDILVDFSKEIGGFNYIRLAHEFEDIFRHKIDLVIRRAVKANYLPFVERYLLHV